MTSRIGKLPVSVPSGVDITVDGQNVLVSGQKGKLEHVVPSVLSVKKQDSTLQLVPQDEQKQTTALHGLTRALIANMVEGVSKGFEKKLIINGTGYRAIQKGSGVQLSVGYSHPVVINPPDGIAIAVQSQNAVVVSGIDKQKVGEVAANIRKIRKPEPYKGKGIRYENEVIRRKAGKAGK
jgi:large subunit ribosomal protein L6